LGLFSARRQAALRRSSQVFTILYLGGKWGSQSGGRSGGGGGGAGETNEKRLKASTNTTKKKKKKRQPTRHRVKLYRNVAKSWKLGRGHLKWEGGKRRVAILLGGAGPLGLLGEAVAGGYRTRLQGGHVLENRVERGEGEQILEGRKEEGDKAAS